MMQSHAVSTEALKHLRKGRSKPDTQSAAPKVGCQLAPRLRMMARPNGSTGLALADALREAGLA